MIQVYTGNGKGKTTAALGLALRATGAGLKVYICQFLKGRHYCELATLKKFKNIKVEQFGNACFLRKAPAKKDRELAQKGLEAAIKALKTNQYQVIILDEINVALSLDLLKIRDVLSMLKNAPAKVEFILTGRSAPVEILKCADLVSEVREIKHYYQRGVKARRGIEH